MSPEDTPPEPRMMRIASSWPRVVIRPAFAPLRWISAFVPTVVPWVRTSTSRQKASNDIPSRSAATRIAASMPSAKSRGVEEALVAVMRPERSSTTQSVKVPPISKPARKRATVVLSRWVEGGMVAYFRPASEARGVHSCRRRHDAHADRLPALHASELQRAPGRLRLPHAHPRRPEDLSLFLGTSVHPRD